MRHEARSRLSVGSVISRASKRRVGAREDGELKPGTLFDNVSIKGRRNVVLAMIGMYASGYAIYSMASAEAAKKVPQSK